MAERSSVTGVSPVPGVRVRHPGQLDWGMGQIQSVVGNRVTVNFEHAGKQVINIDIVKLTAAEETPQPP